MVMTSTLRPVESMKGISARSSTRLVEPSAITVEMRSQSRGPVARSTSPHTRRTVEPSSSAMVTSKSGSLIVSLPLS